MSSIRVLVVEDDLEFARQFCAHLTAHTEFDTPVHAASLLAAKAALATQDFDILAIDLELPDGSGLELVNNSEIAGRKIVVTVFGDEATVVDAIAAGADGFVLKDDANLVAALLQIRDGHSPLSAPVAAHMLRRFRESEARTATRSKDSITALSPRELETLNALAMGMSYQETADTLGISHHTAADHVKSVYRKLSVKTSAAAVLAGVRAGLIDVSNGQ